MKHIKINVEDHKLLNDGTVCEDITSVTLPSFEHPTTPVENVSGMAMNLNVPNTTRYNAAELSIAHNNGENCESLAEPGTHDIEFRMARQDFNAVDAALKYEGIKYLAKVMFVATEKGTIEKGNPWGSTCRYSIIRFEEIHTVDGKAETKVLVDATANKLEVNGVSFTDDLSSLLD